jgi:hypothetical protein
MVKYRNLISGDNSVNIQAKSVSLIFPEQATCDTNNPISALEESLHFISGLKTSSFLIEASEALGKLYHQYNRNYYQRVPLHLLASLTEEYALVQMDLGRVFYCKDSASSLFLKASRIWKTIGNVYNPLFDLHMLGVCSGIAGRNERALSIYKLCQDNIPKSNRFKALSGHVSRDLAIALNRSGEYESAFKLLSNSRSGTEKWCSEFNFALDTQKLAIAAAGCQKYALSWSLLESASKVMETKDDLSYVKNLNAKHFFAVKAKEMALANALYSEIEEICNIKGLCHQLEVLHAQSLFGTTK